MSQTSNLPTLKIQRRGEQVNLFALAGIVLVVGLLLSMGLLSSRRAVESSEIAGYILVVAGVAALVWGGRVAKRGPDELILSPTGLHDPQLLDREIPWADITGFDIAGSAKGTITFHASKATLNAASYAMVGKFLHGTRGGSGIAYANVHFIDPIAEIIPQVQTYMIDVANSKNVT